MANCPMCGVEFSSPWLREAARTGATFFCPRGHRLEFRPPGWDGTTEAEQLAELERMVSL